MRNSRRNGSASRLLGIDFGTGGAKSCVMDDQGVVLAYAFREYPIIHTNPGWSEHDPEAYWRVTLEIIEEVLRESQTPGHEIAGIAVSSAVPSMVMVDGQGHPVARACNLMDRRAVAEVDIIRDIVGEATIEEVTANRIEDHPNLVNLFWYQRNRPQIYSSVYKAMTIDGFIVSRLTDQFTLNRSSAIFFGIAFDIRTGRFRDDILEKLGIDPSLMPTLFDPTEQVGGVTAAAARETGLHQGTPVVAGQVDCNAAWIAGGAIEPGDMQLNLGTSGVLGILHQDPEFLRSPEGLRVLNIPYTTAPRQTFAAVAVTTTGGQALRYLRDTLGAGEVDLAKQLNVSAYDLITVQAKDIPAGSEGLLVLPYLMGERSPIWDTAARAVMFGLSLHHTRGHIIRAFLEGVAYALYDSLSVLQKSGLGISYPLVFNEGGAKSEIWRRIITDVFGIPTVLLEGRTGAPLGDAILAGVGVGVFDDFTVAKDWARYSDHLEPDAANHALYGEYFRVYKNVYTSLEPNFRELQTLLRKGTDQ